MGNAEYMGAAVETRPARPQHLIDQFRKSLINHHVLASPQSHRATVSPHGVAGSLAARWRVRLASWGWLPIPRRQGRLRTREGPKIHRARGTVHPGSWLGTL